VNASPAPSGSGRHKPAKQLAGLGELPLRFRGLRAGELEELRGGDQTTAFREVPALGPEIDHRCALGPCWREPPAQLHHLNPVLSPTKHGRGLSRPDIIAGFKIGDGRWKDDRSAELAEGREIFAVGDVVSEVVAHGGSTESCIGSIALVVNGRTVAQVQ
jgi:hypothetical protein